MSRALLPLALALALIGCCEGLTVEGGEETPQGGHEEAPGASQGPAQAQGGPEGASPENEPPEAPGEPGEASPGAPDPQVEASVRQAASLRRSDPARARALYRSACEEEHPGACLMLANMLERGEGGEPDPEEARALFQQACFAGNTGACDRLGH